MVLSTNHKVLFAETYLLRLINMDEHFAGAGYSYLFFDEGKWYLGFARDILIK